MPVNVKGVRWYSAHVDTITYGRWLRGQRQRRIPRMTQQQLADAIEVDRSYVVKIETGKISVPTLETRLRIHAVLGTTEDELIAAAIVAPSGYSTGPPITRTGTPPNGTALRLVTPSPLAYALDAIWQNLTDEQRAYALNALDAALSMPAARLGTVVPEERVRSRP